VFADEARNMPSLTVNSNSSSRPKRPPDALIRFLGEQLSHELLRRTVGAADLSPLDLLFLPVSQAPAIALGYISTTFHLAGVIPLTRSSSFRVTLLVEHTAASSVCLFASVMKLT
jgi:hypothetical protein